jgi:NAD(P)-dependent dehydrogenase (short-subunit alcohol dehydrogenase family)
MAAIPQTHVKTAVITGAGSGLGRAFTLAWAAQGCKVGVLDLDLAAAAETLQLVERAGGSGETYRCDVSSLTEVEAAAEYFWGRWGRVDLLVNNAGVGGGGSMGEVPMDHWEKVLGIDLWGVIYNCHAHVPRMKAAGGGHIVNVSSAAGLYSAPRFSPYNAPKAAVVAISQTLYGELAPWRIGVTVVCPPVVKTNIIDNSLGMTDGVAYDISYELELLRTAMLNSRITPEELARRTVRAVQRKRLYVVAGAGNYLSWLNARFAPSLFYRNMAFLTRHGWEKPVFAYFARKGLM